MVHRLKTILQLKVAETEHVYLVNSILFGLVGIVSLLTAVRRWLDALALMPAGEQDPTTAAIMSDIAGAWRSSAAWSAVVALIWLTGSGVWALNYRRQRRRRQRAPDPDATSAVTR